MVQYGFGHHFKSIPVEPRTKLLLYFWLLQLFYKISVHLTKISLIMLYMRIFGTVQWFRNVSRGLIGLIGAYIVVAFFTGVFQCNPIPKSYITSIPGTCIANVYFFIFNAAFGTATDLIVLILPFPLLWKLKLRLGQKLALVPIFGLGVFIVTISSFRLASLASRIASDVTYDLMSIVWTLAEMNIAIICTSLPTVRVLLARMFPKQFGSSSTKKSGQHSYDSKNANGKWSRVEGKDGINLTDVTNVPRSGSEEFILENQLPGIQKTVQYRVDYS
jgi:hypothetical protein